MRNVNVTFQLFISKEVDKPLLFVDPVFTVDFTGDKDSDEDFHKLCDIQYSIEQLVQYYRALGCKCEARRVEYSFLCNDC